jgi:ABC-type dipeptide/oligopeptide/nickel transport system ATPase component
MQRASASRKKKSKKVGKNEVINFYTKIKKDDDVIDKNPNYEQHKIKLNSRIAVVGSSGSGKTNTVINLIKKFSGTFFQIIICTKDSDEPLYNLLREKMSEEELTIFEGEIPDMSDYDKEQPRLIIFDDLVLEGKKTQAKIAEWFIRSRKKSFTCCYISQSYFGIPSIIRKNINYLILKKISSIRDLNMIMKDYSLDLTKHQLLSMYKYATKSGICDFLMVDIDADDENRFRHNWLQILDPRHFLPNPISESSSF